MVDADGKPVLAKDGGHRVQEGDVVELQDPVLNVNAHDITGPKKAPAELTSEEVAFARSLVIFRDANIIAMNKPHGLATQGGSRIMRHIDRLLPALAAEGEERPRLVHRLDKDTSGVLLLGRSRAGAARLSEMFRNPGDISKDYLAFLTCGLRTPSGVIDMPLMQSPGEGPDGEREQTRIASRVDIDPRLEIERGT